MQRVIPAILVVLGLLTADAPVRAQSSLSSHLEKLVQESGISGSVIVTRNGATLLSAGLGMSNRELLVPNTPKTKFRIGSVTKQFTAMAILILQDRGKIRVGERVGTYLDDVPEAWKKLTLHQLLTHTSGMTHSWTLPGFRDTMMIPGTLDSTLKRFFNEPTLFEPGTDFRYSGPGYFLLAKVIEAVSRRPYDEFLNSEVFLPLAMSDTGADRPETILMGRASGYEELPEGNVRNAPVVFMPILTGGGNLYSTVEDMARWDRALTRRALVSEESYKAMFRPERDGYAYGWRVSKLEGQQTVSHSGGVPGFNAFILRVPEEEICVVVLTNLVPGRARSVAESLASVVIKDTVSSGKSF